MPVSDIDYARSLWRLMALDQSYFYEIGVAVRKLGFDSPVVAALQKLKFLIQEGNIKELEALIDKKGWPKISQVGENAAGTAFYIIQHSDAVKQEKYLSLLKTRCEEKEASWIHYAMLYDRLKMNLNLPQRYGTQFNLNNRATGKFELYQLEDKAKVNDWRKEVGLPALTNIE
jgi:transposase-like protein